MKIYNQIYTYIHLKIGDEKKNPSFVNTQHISTHCHQGKKASIIGYKRAYDISYLASGGWEKEVFLQGLMLS